MPERIGQYTEETARYLLDTINQLVASGWALPGNKQPTAIPFQRQTFFINDSGEEIPPYACMQITEMEKFGQNYCKVDKYDEDVFGGFLFNGHREVADKDSGVAQFAPRFLGLRENNTDAVTLGHLWGPDPGEWFLKPNGGPWQAVNLRTEDADETAIWFQADLATTYRAVVTTEITARSGSTEGSGVVTLKTVGASNGTAILQNGVNVTTLLTGTSAVDAELVVARTTNGRLQVISEDCGDG